MPLAIRALDSTNSMGGTLYGREQADSLYASHVETRAVACSRTIAGGVIMYVDTVGGIDEREVMPLL